MNFHVRIITFHRGEADISTHEEEEEEEATILFLLLALITHDVRNGDTTRRAV